MSGQLDQSLNRYQNPVIVDHLASNYVIGTLPFRVRKRTEDLMRFPEYRALNERIGYWEKKLSPLNGDVPELAPKSDAWQNIESAIAPETAAEQTTKATGWRLFGFPVSNWVAAFSFMIAVLLGVSQVQQPDELGNLSYVAVMTDDNQQPQVVAATYGDSQTLMLDILELPDIDSEEESYELWVTSKTDKQARSLGVIPVGSDSFSRELTVAEWRLIKDSDSLLITVEEFGGSSIGSPMGDVISQGLCIRLSAWQET